MSPQLTEKGRHNRDTLTKLLDDSGFDSKYLLTWGLPDFWDDSFWDYSEYVLALVEHFEDKYKIYDSREDWEF
jgi:hypothetical protein